MVKEEWRHPIKVQKTEDLIKKEKSRGPSQSPHLARVGGLDRLGTQKEVVDLAEIPILVAVPVVILVGQVVVLEETPILAVVPVVILVGQVVDLAEIPILVVVPVVILVGPVADLAETPILAVAPVVILAGPVVDPVETPILAVAPVVILAVQVVVLEEIPILAGPEETPIPGAVHVAILVAEVGEDNAETLSRTRNLVARSPNTR